jgi:CMP-N-acetylneuraminic acid synthetase
LIPARGGSKGIPRKNLSVVGGKTLLARTLEVAEASTAVTKIVVSTDDEEIAAAARLYGENIPHMRPVELATDDAAMLPVIQDVVASLDEGGYRADVIVLLQPTSPLRTASHVDDAVGLLQSSGADSVVTVCQIPHHFSPVSAMQIEGGVLKPYLEGEGVRLLDRHLKPIVYSRSGPSVLVTRYETLMQLGDLYGEQCQALIISWTESLDIDSSEDLAVAEALLASPMGEALQ